MDRAVAGFDVVAWKPGRGRLELTGGGAGFDTQAIPFGQGQGVTVTMNLFPRPTKGFATFCPSWLLKSPYLVSLFFSTADEVVRYPPPPPFIRAVLLVQARLGPGG